VPSLCEKLSSNKLQPAPVLANLTDPANCAYSALVSRLILASVEGTDLEGRAGVNWCERCSTDFKFGELVEFDLDCIIGVALTCSLDLSCLERS
jgi:hypothetical protein